jgi:tetratricopeptide (TPR) repeat protein
MKRLAGLFLALYSALSSAYGQSIDELDMLFGQKRYEQVIAKGKQMIANDPGSAYVNQVVGSAYLRVLKYDSAIPFYTRAIELDNDSTYISGWARVGLGMAYLNTGKREQGIQQELRAITVGAGVTIVKKGKEVLDSVEYELPERQYDKNYLPDWVTIQSPVITYKFQDTIGSTAFVYKFIQLHDSAYYKLRDTFRSVPPAKPIVHVWSDPEIAKKVLHRSLGFSFSKQCFSHVSRYQSVGHELSHILSFWSWGTANTGYSKFINEGIAVCFDQGNYDKYAYARQVVAKYGTDVLKVWKNEKDYDDDVLYPLGGAFVQYMYEHSTPEQFRQLVKQQKLDNVRVIYGAQFDTMVADFDKLMGVKG